MELITYISTFNVIVCKVCRTGIILDTQFDSHFIRQHGLSQSLRRSMRHNIKQQYPNAAQQVNEVARHFPVHRPMVALPELGNPYVAFMCAERDCRYICRTARTMQEHYRQQHNWRNPTTRGGSLIQRQTMQRP
jgi:hypothetical protein